MQQIELKELEPCKFHVSYEADAVDIINKRAEVIKAFRKAPVKGFRPGKASDDAIKMQYKTQIDDSLKRALAEDAYHNTIFEKKLKPHGAPRFNSMLLQNMQFKCEFEVFTKPEITNLVYKNLEIAKPHQEMQVSEIAEKMMQELRMRAGDTTPYTESDFVQTGDSIIIDYEGFVDGVKIDNLTATGEMLTVGNTPLYGFDDNLLGMNMGDTREFSILAPPEGLPSIANKKVDFKVTLSIGSKTTPAALDDTLAEKFGKTNLEDLRALVNGSAASRVSEQTQKAINDAISHKLVASTEVEVPPFMYLSEAEYLAQQSKLNWQTMIPEDREKFITMAIKNVKLALILDSIREQDPETQISDEEVFNIIKSQIAKNTQNMGKSVDETLQDMQKNGYLPILFSRIKDQYALDALAKTVIITE